MNLWQQRFRTAIGLMLLLTPLFASGCQSLHPFAQRTREKIVSAREWANGGLEAFQCGRLQQAKGFFTRATEQSPHDFRVRANLARTLHKSGETSEAIAHMQQAVEQSGNDPLMLVELGEMYLAVGQLAPANRQAQSALKIDHRFAAAWHLKGKVSRAKGDLKQALAELQKAAGFAPDALAIQMEIAETYQASGELMKSLAAIEHLLAKHPAESQPEAAIVAKADVLMQLEQYSSAVAMLQRASRDQNQSKPILVRLGQAQLMAGQFSQARSTVARGVQTFEHSMEFEQLAEAIDQQADSSGRLVIR